MPKWTRIYTRSGDAGATGLVGGSRVKKNAPRIETYGTIDELSSAIGVARAALRPLFTIVPVAPRLDAWLSWTQDLLFDLGSDLATRPPDRAAGISVGSEHVEALERAIDEADAELTPLATFIHPGGSMPGAQLHFARTICRRAERLLVSLVDSGEENAPEAMRYLNRLSDGLFVWARWINAALDVPEQQWNKAGRPPQK